MSTLVYKYNYEDSETLINEGFKYNLIIWRPSLSNFIPPQKSKKYLIYWLFHYLRIFRNRSYAAILIYDNKSLIASMLIVPAHFKWPFMAKNDLQFTYVLTYPQYRGKGVGEMLLRYGIQTFGSCNHDLWYITNTENLASINLCTKVGFDFFSNALRKGIMKITYLT